MVRFVNTDPPRAACAYMKRAEIRVGSHITLRCTYSVEQVSLAQNPMLQSSPSTRNETCMNDGKHDVDSDGGSLEGTK